MNVTFAVAEIAGAVIGAIGLALALEWFTLNKILHAMPKEHAPVQHGKFQPRN